MQNPGGWEEDAPPRMVFFPGKKGRLLQDSGQEGIPAGFPAG
jgi:hypothetical protein